VNSLAFPDGRVIFRLIAKPLGNEKFHRGGFWEYPDEILRILTVTGIVMRMINL